MKRKRAVRRNEPPGTLEALSLKILLAHAYDNARDAIRLRSLEHMLSPTDLAAGLDRIPLARLSSAELDQVYASLLQACADVMRGQWVTPDTLDGVRLVVIRSPQTGRFELVYASTRQAWWSAWWFVLARLLAAAGDRLQQCPVCPRVFVRLRREEYCSTACSQKARSRRHYEMHSQEIRERRALAYAESRKPAKVTPRWQRTAPDGLAGATKTAPTKIRSPKRRALR
jgi:hypothetical protein